MQSAKKIVIIILAAIISSCHKSNDPLSNASKMAGSHNWHGTIENQPSPSSSVYTYNTTWAAIFYLISATSLKCYDSLMLVDTLIYRSTDAQAKTISFSYMKSSFGIYFLDSIIYNYSTGNMVWIRNSIDGYGSSYDWTLYSP
jgi:hypothetical protein